MLDKGLLKVREVVERYPFSESQVYKLMKKRKLAYVQVGGMKLVPLAAIEAMLKDGLVPAVPTPAAGGAATDSASG